MPVIDLRILREDPDQIRHSQEVRGESSAVVDDLAAADTAHRNALQQFEALRAEQKQLGKQVSRASGDEKQELLTRTKALSNDVKAADATANKASEALTAAAQKIPNIVDPAVKPGGEDDSTVLRHVGDRVYPEKCRDHLELGEKLGMIDMERGAKTSGSRFHFLTGDGALLELGMLQLAIQHATKNGFTPMITPVLVRPQSMQGTGFLGEHADEVYHIPSDDLYLVGTSEVPLAAYHSDEIIDLTQPRRYAGWSTCFRREAGSYGKDTRGIIRVHQFDKVEMFSYCRPEDAADEHERLLAFEEEMLAKIEVPYRVVDIAGGDLGTSAARKFDCEGWIPSQGTYRELTSTSNCTTFQARRLGVRYRDENGKAQIAATLNGTLATTRWIVAILENHQQPDGSVKVPEALQPFLGKELIEPVKG